MTTMRKRIELGGWTFRPASADAVPIDSPWPLAAAVPSSVHTDLLAHGLIPDPFVGRNEHEVAWIADADWIYECSVVIDVEMRDCARVDLVFDGLDTLAEISVNGRPVGATENMHRSYRFPITDLAADGRVDIAVTFRSATIEAERRRATWGYWPSSSFDRPFNYVRKMACSWGWDWGPSLTTAGLWRPAWIEAWDTARIDAIVPEVTIDERDVGHVTVRAHLDEDPTAPGAISLYGELRDPDGEIVAASRSERDRLDLEPGRVRRWHRRGRGDQPMYELLIEVHVDGRVVDRSTRRLGFRSVSLDTSPDDYGSSFTIVVNGEPLFARGVNWIPDDPLITRVDRTRYESRLDEAIELGADLVRVWGGGIYESDDFYDICDDLGLLVWQDFAFACAAYPEHELRDEIEAEAIEQVRRLAWHPSLVVWNGNNENSWGIVDWGWAERLDGRAWGDGYYRDLLPAVLAANDPTRPYSIASPYSGSPLVHPNADAHGTKHVWDVWNDVDYADYRRYVPRFVSEFGWQAPATSSTLRRAAGEHELTPDHPSITNRQKAANGQMKLRVGLDRHFPPPPDFDSWVWTTQLNQARAVRAGVDHFRSNRGLCMGAIWWQLNDCWPAISWSVLDSDGRRKPAWYALRSAFADRLLTIQPRGDALVVAAINDGPARWRDTLTTARHDFDGTVQASIELTIDVAPGARVVAALPPEVCTPADPCAELLRVTSRAAFAEPAHHFFTSDRNLDYAPQRLSVQVDRATALITAATLTRDLALLADRIDPHLTASAMLHTLLPGESVAVTLQGDCEGSVSARDVANALESANSAVVTDAEPRSAIPPVTSIPSAASAKGPVA